MPSTKETGIFRDIDFTWKGEVVKLESKNVMRAISVVEDVITLKELSEYSSSPAGVRFSRLSRAYGSLLRHCGQQVSDEEVYAEMFASLASDDKERGARLVYQSVDGLLRLMLPPGITDQSVEKTSGE